MQPAQAFHCWKHGANASNQMAFLVLVVGLMAYFPDTRIALYVGPAFLVLLTVLFYAFKLQPTNVSQAAVRPAA